MNATDDLSTLDPAANSLRLPPRSLFHVTTGRKAKLYRQTGRINAPVRGFDTLMAAMAWAMKTGRKVILCVEPVTPPQILPDHHNDYGRAWWTESIPIERVKCAYSAEGAWAQPKIMNNENATVSPTRVGSDAVLAVGSRWAINYGSSTYKVEVVSLFDGRVYWRAESIGLDGIDSEKYFLQGARCAMPLPAAPKPWWKRLFKVNINAPRASSDLFACAPVTTMLPCPHAPHSEAIAPQDSECAVDHKIREAAGKSGFVWKMLPRAKNYLC